MTSRGFERIDPDECMSLLRHASFGRVGTRMGDELVVLPVYYVVAGNDVVFRTDPGAKLIAAVLETRVAFEVDDAAEWSVLVVGHARELRASSDVVDELRERLDAFWPDGERRHLVAIAIEKITGRRRGTRAA
jgi:nitroimidazol reductase NimA-like FMN-containing flavoprotein (pyridoxamine 5'-phosphate oxidase superfamily)